MNLDQLIIKVDNLNFERERLLGEITALAKNELATALASVPGLRTVSFTSGTPSFNDGDPCYRRTDVTVNDDDGEIEYPDDYPVLSDASVTAIAELVANFEDGFIAEHDDNFALKWTVIPGDLLEPAKVEFTHGEYDIGY